MRPLALGIDLGTSGVRSAVIDAEGRVLGHGALAAMAHPMPAPSRSLVGRGLRLP